MTGKVRLGIVGLGNMGSLHCKLLQKTPELELVAGCDIDTERLDKITERYGCAGFTDARELLKARICDAVLVATPHYSHTTIGIDALQRGYHLMVEKPISVHKADAIRLINAHKNEDQVFAAMFNQRTNPAYSTIKEMLDNGTMGAVRRVQWTITDWFRSQAYYDSGGWRATWNGEGGGVLLNQCPHQLDLLQWLFGMPERVHAVCGFGAHHDIEVEDDVIAMLRYPGGVSGVFTTTTGEAPGINRLEIAAENGLLSYDPEDGFIRWRRNAKTVTAAIAENAGFEKPETEEEIIRFDNAGGQHFEVLNNFAAAILHGEQLIAPAQEGINSVELANSMLLSAWRGKAVAVPISPRGYARQLKQRADASVVKKTVRKTVVDDMSASF
jgi:predicted dehydrogenase